MASCPVCQDAPLDIVLDLPAVPAISTEFHDEPERARTAPRGDLLLGLCRVCALVWNVAFDPADVEYTPSYENSQHFSPAFRVFATELARSLSDRYALRGGTVVEIGSGKGEFLAVLCDAANCTGVGFDPTFDGDVDHPRVRVERRLFEPRTAAPMRPSLVLARHVLEHVADPVGFISNIRAAATEVPVYIEVPNADFVFSDAGMWDLIYQHVGYFGPSALRNVMEHGGYRVRRLTPVFRGQFLAVEAAPAIVEPARPDPRAVADACSQIEGFSDRLLRRLDRLREKLSSPAGGQVVVWGAGAKGVALLNLLDLPDAVDRVVDVNPRKVGRHIPGTGHRIESPDSLRGAEVDTVLILNPAYRDEIQQQLHQVGVDVPVEIA